jgi:hypothetical protein
LLTNTSIIAPDLIRFICSFVARQQLIVLGGVSLQHHPDFEKYSRYLLFHRSRTYTQYDYSLITMNLNVRSIPIDPLRVDRVRHLASLPVALWRPACAWRQSKQELWVFGAPLPDGKLENVSAMKVFVLDTNCNKWREAVCPFVLPREGSPIFVNDQLVSRILKLVFFCLKIRQRSWWAEAILAI